MGQNKAKLTLDQDKKVKYMKTLHIILIVIITFAKTTNAQTFYRGGDYILPKKDSLAIYSYPCEQHYILKYLARNDSIKYDGSIYNCSNSSRRTLEIVINQEAAFVLGNDAVIHYNRDTLNKKDIFEYLSEDSLEFLPDGYYTFEMRLNSFLNKYSIVGDISAISHIFSKFYKISDPYEKLGILKKNNIPLYLSRVEINNNIIGNPEVTLHLTNISKYDIDAYNVEIYCYNRYGNPVKKYNSGSNMFSGTSQDVIYSGNESTGTWTLYGQELTTNVRVFLSKVHFTNGKTVVISNKQLTKIEGKLD